MADSIERRGLPPEEYVAPRVAYLEEVVYPRAAERWKEIGAGYIFIEARLHVPEAQASRAALALYDIDREARRAVRIMTGRGAYSPRPEEPPVIHRAVERAKAETPRRLLRPTPIPLGGFRLLRADEGSADFYLDAYGLLASVLLADPIQLALTLKSIFGWPTRVVIRRIFRGQAKTEEVHQLNEFEFSDEDLRIAGRLAEGSRLELRYRGPDGTELETTFHT